MNSNKINVDWLIYIVSAEILIWHWCLVVTFLLSAIFCQRATSPFSILWRAIGGGVSLFLFCFYHYNYNAVHFKATIDNHWHRIFCMRRASIPLVPPIHPYTEVTICHIITVVLKTIGKQAIKWFALDIDKHMK